MGEVREEIKDKRIKGVRELHVYQKAFETAMEIYEITKRFPVEERYSLTDQVRRSSRSVCANLAEGWRKRRYKAAVVNKLSDAAQEATETQTWIEFSERCGYIDRRTRETISGKYDEVCSMLTNMERKAAFFC